MILKNESPPQQVKKDAESIDEIFKLSSQIKVDTNIKKEKKVPAKVLRAFYILRNNNSMPGIVDGHSHFFVSFFLAHAHAIRQNPVRGLYDRDARAQRVRARNSF